MLYTFKNAAVKLGSIFYSSWCSVRKRMQRICKCGTNLSVPGKEAEPSESVDLRFQVSFSGHWDLLL